MFSEPATNIARLGLTDGMKVVDVGAGSGYYSVEAAKVVGRNGRVYAIDVQKNILDRIRNNGISLGLRNIEVVWGNVEKIGGSKLREGIADRIIASNILFQIDKMDDFVLEMKRLLKQGGKLLLIDWSELSPIGPKNFVPSAEAEALFEKGGFTLETSFNAGDHHYGLIFVK
ncbi:MAG: methyltransferase domain-containing protein [Patescibacteria group bacterium]|nr:methyltransferase domain-containing protein [Patescibacteria group bacterium]